MSTAAQPEPEHVFEWEEVARALFQVRGIKSGLWRVAARMNFAAITSEMLAVGEKVPRSMPTSVTGVSGVVLFKADAPGPLVFDASGKGEGAVPPRAPAKAPAKRRAKT